MRYYKRINWILFVTVGIFQSCNNPGETEQVTDEPQITKPINLMDCQVEKFEVLFEKLEEFLPLMHTGCKEFKVAYGVISQEEKENMVNSMSEVITHHLENYPALDSSIYLQEYKFTDLEFCEPTLIYDSSDNCSFYTGLVYHSLDYKIQFIRLFQHEREEYFDLYIDLTKDEPNVIGFG